MNPFRILIAGLIVATAASAAPPEVVRFHGVISQLGEQPVQDGNYTFLAEIFAEATGGTAVYTQTTTASVSGGAYTVVLSPTSAGQLNDAFADSPRFLQITVVSGPGVVNPETLLPRQEIASVPFAITAESAVIADAARALPPGFIYGFQHRQNPADPNYAIDISPGVARAASNAGNIEDPAGMTKRIDGPWAPGTNVGGLPPSLTLTANTWYRLFAIAKEDGTAGYGWDTSAVAANLLGAAAGYTQYRQIAWHRVDASLSIVAYRQRTDDPNVIMWNFPMPEIVEEMPTTSPANKTVVVPPDATGIFSFSHHAAAHDPTGYYFHRLYSPYSPQDPAVTDANATLHSARAKEGGKNAGTVVLTVQVNASSEVRVRSSDTWGRLFLTTQGFIYRR